MAVFKFKEFEVFQQNSAMKVGTDSVLLGALLQAQEPQTILDIGTGTGLLALMMAQRFNDASIDAVEIEEQAFVEATKNAAQSKWKVRVKVFHQSLQNFANQSLHPYDLIVCNPPYYEAENHFGIEVQSRSHARHTVTLSFDELLDNLYKLLTVEGRCWMVLPKTEAELFVEKAKVIGLFLTHHIAVYPNPNKAFNRLIFCLSKTPEEMSKETLFIKDEQGNYSQQYKDATMPFLLWNK